LRGPCAVRYDALGVAWHVRCYAGKRRKVVLGRGKQTS
jgi:hypothetical protein